MNVYDGEGLDSDLREEESNLVSHFLFDTTFPFLEPYSNLERRGRKEPEALAAASLKRLSVENQPYLVGGCCQHGMSGSSALPNNRVNGVKFSFSLNKLKAPQHDANNILSVADKYNYMRQTFRKRLAFGD